MFEELSWVFPWVVLYMVLSIMNSWYYITLVLDEKEEKEFLGMMYEARTTLNGMPNWLVWVAIVFTITLDVISWPFLIIYRFIKVTLKD